MLTGDNGETEDQSGEAVQKMNTLSDLLGLFSGSVGYDDSDSIESDEITEEESTTIITNLLNNKGFVKIMEAIENYMNKEEI